MGIIKITMLLFIGFFTLISTSCSKKKTISLNVASNSFDITQPNEIRNISVTYVESSSSATKYNNAKALAYAKKYALQELNSCGKFINDGKNSDCSHFIAHCLDSGGIKITNTDPSINLCPRGLVFRNVDVVKALDNLAQQYKNVQKVDKDQTIVGDYLFLYNVAKFRVSHALMVCEPKPTLKDYKMYGHTANRNCEIVEPSIVQFYDAAYRITDSN